MTTFLESPLALAIGIVIVVLGIVACLWAMCVIAAEWDNESGEE